MKDKNMNDLLNIKTPAESIAQTRKADYNLSKHAISSTRLEYWNLTTEALTEVAIFRKEGSVASGGPLIAHTGKHTGRSANDKFMVQHTDSENDICCGIYNRPFSEHQFDTLIERM